MTGKKALIAAAIIAAALPAPSRAQILAARVAEGSLSGVRQDKVGAFLGVPFAAPPVGALRWKPPLPAVGWQGVRQADKAGASCQQELMPEGFGPWTHEYVVTGAVSEDCLFLNVWTPAKTADERLPVMVWIHGGGFSGGSGSVPIYDGAGLAAKGIVVVSINYRLGAYGFLAHPELTAESATRSSGNYGLLDQLAALRWVQRNISAFGGDPDKVTIAGQSAGAASVHHMIATPLASGLFARAIAQSGSGMGIETPTRAQAEQTGLALQRAAGAADLAALRRLTPAELAVALRRMTDNSATAGLPFMPILDGFVLPDALAAIANTNDTPILTGMTANEMGGMDPLHGRATPASVRARFSKDFGPFAARFLARYPTDSDAAAEVSREAVARDEGLAAMALWAKRRRTAKPIYAYLWSHIEPGPEARRYKAFHSSEMPYVFNTLDKSPERPFTAADRKIAGLMSRYWVNWVRTGNPNGEGLPEWPRYTQDGKAILEIGEQVRARPILDAATLKLFEDYAASGGKLGLF